MVSYIGELLNIILPFSIPGSIYGMILMFILLSRGYIQLYQVKEVSNFLLDIMPILFIPSAVGVMTELDELSSIWWQTIVISVMTTIVVMIISGKVTQKIIELNEKQGKTHNIKTKDNEGRN